MAETMYVTIRLQGVTVKAFLKFKKRSILTFLQRFSIRHQSRDASIILFQLPVVYFYCFQESQVFLYDVQYFNLTLLVWSTVVLVCTQQTQLPQYLLRRNEFPYRKLPLLQNVQGESVLQLDGTSRISVGILLWWIDTSTYEQRPEKNETIKYCY